ncbi:hypothetical protein Hanom_Chr03g00236791 [Helianthus anomalus]
MKHKRERVIAWEKAKKKLCIFGYLIIIITIIIIIIIIIIIHSLFCYTLEKRKQN